MIWRGWHGRVVEDLDKTVRVRKVKTNPPGWRWEAGGVLSWIFEEAKDAVMDLAKFLRKGVVQ